MLICILRQMTDAYDTCRIVTKDCRYLILVCNRLLVFYYLAALCWFLSGFMEKVFLIFMWWVVFYCFLYLYRFITSLVALAELMILFFQWKYHQFDGCWWFKDAFIFWLGNLFLSIVINSGLCTRIFSF